MSIFLKVNRQLESRIQEIWQSGSEGGAKPYFVPTPIATPKEPSRRVRYDSCRCAHRFEDWEEISNAVSLSRINWQRAMAYSASVPRGHAPLL
jgi:hypothetical protein